jgi:pimeloyl-ACP methyl ester carboxylesterase
MMSPMETTIAGLNAVRRGSGPPMLLLHGIGHRWQMWLPVFDSLARDFDVVAVDLPGFGRSPRIPEDRAGGLDGGTDYLVGVLDELGWEGAHIVGNSLGGWLGLELAARGKALSVTALAPAGLWADRAAVDRRLRFWFALWVGGARRSTPAMVRLLRFRLVRTLALYRLFGRPWRIPGDVAIGDAEALAASAFDEVFESDPDRSFTGGRHITVPITVTWHSRDPLFHRARSTTAELPDHTDVLHLRGCGHVPTWDDPPLVLETIRSTVAAAVAAPLLTADEPGPLPVEVVEVAEAAEAV